MEAQYAPSKISSADLEWNARQWSDSSLVPKEIKPFEELRLHTIIETVELRKAEGNAFLEKAEFLVLVEWRAHLAKTYNFVAFEHAAKNSIAKVRETTQRAFREYESNKENTNNPIKILRELEGVTLQTATLILSTYDPVNLPYFSDRLDRYLHWEETKAENRHADKSIAHSMKEYSTICAKVKEIRDRIKEESGKDIRAVDIEIVARFVCNSAKKHVDAQLEEADDIALVPEEVPRKKRKTNAQIWNEEHPRGSEKDPFRHIHITVDKGRDGSPTYDEFGFEMDYDECVEWEKPVTRTMRKPTEARTNRMVAKWEQHDKDLRKISELMDDKENFAALDGHSIKEIAKENAYMERVRKDLGMKTYHVSLADVEKWHKKGFRADEGEFDLEDWGEEKTESYWNMSTGSALRR